MRSNTALARVEMTMKKGFPTGSLFVYAGRPLKMASPVPA
jgi:hypothetical protein